MSQPFFGEEFEFTQPDGSKLRVRGWGDQQQAVFETLDGRPVRRDPQTGYYNVVTGPEPPTRGPAGADVPPAYRLPTRTRSNGQPPRAGSEPGLPPAGTRWQQRRAERRLAMSAALTRGPLAAPPARQTVGTFVGLCLLVDFPDVPGTISRDEVEAFCNQPGYSGFGNRGSVSEYFRDVSGGRLTYTNLVAPYYTAQRGRDYYTDESVDQPLRAVELIKEALDHLVASGLDLSTLSTDSRGFVYALNVFYAGARVNNWAQGLWPHAYHLLTNYRLRPDAVAHDYQITNMGQELTLGTFCHENGHMLCDFPDLYDYGGESAGVGAYCLMCAGGNISPKNPVHVGAYLKHAAGWASDVATLAPGSTVTLGAGTNEFGLLRRSATEYFIVENRQQSGRDIALPDAGLAIWHVDEMGDNSDEQMSPAQHYECTLVQADGKSHLERNVNLGDGSDLFHAGHRDRFGPSTNPPSHWWDGTESALELFDIGPAGASIVVSVR